MRKYAISSCCEPPDRAGEAQEAAAATAASCRHAGGAGGKATGRKPLGMAAA